MDRTDHFTIMLAHKLETSGGCILLIMIGLLDRIFITV